MLRKAWKLRKPLCRLSCNIVNPDAVVHVRRVFNASPISSSPEGITAQGVLHNSDAISMVILKWENIQAKPMNVRTKRLTPFHVQTQHSATLKLWCVCLSLDQGIPLVSSQFIAMVRINIVFDSYATSGADSAGTVTSRVNAEPIHIEQLCRFLLYLLPSTCYV